MSRAYDVFISKQKSTFKYCDLLLFLVDMFLEVQLYEYIIEVEINNILPSNLQKNILKS